MDIRNIPSEQQLTALKQMLRLTKITVFKLAYHGGPKPEDIAFIEKVGSNQLQGCRLERCRSSSFQDRSLVRHGIAYLEAVKNLEPSYTGARLVTVFGYAYYRIIIKKCPNLEMKYSMRIKEIDQEFQALT